MNFEDILVAVHGIGKQSRFSTVRSVATRVATSRTYVGKGITPVSSQPLGYFHSDVKRVASVRLVDDATSLNPALQSVGFSEVFWADIPQEVVKEGRTLEETKEWASTVVARAQALCERAKQDPARHWIVPPDFGLAGEVLAEIIETVYVLENLTRIAEKAGLFKFNLREVLEEYLGDVQLVTEFSYYRTDVIGRFHEALDSISQQYPNARLHIVAHSEGTVISFLGLLHAAFGRKFHPADPPAVQDASMEELGQIPAWLKQVHGFMTIGSPMDKHLLLWQRLWEKFDVNNAKEVLPTGQIHWRNYYDYGDPVGFKLDSTRLWLQKKNIKMFEFCGCKDCKHDMGFARYLFPGEAHTEYWNDSDVFEHFITNVVKIKDQTKLNDAVAFKPTPPPRNKPLIKLLSPALPYVGSFFILLLGIFILFKAVFAYIHPSFDPLQKFVRFEELGVSPPDSIHGWNLLATVFGLTGLIAGATLLARFPRLAVGKVWLGFGFVALLIGFAFYVELVPAALRSEIGARFWYLARYAGTWAPTVGILGVTAVAGMSGYLAMSRRFENSDRRQRRFLRGTRPLMVCGAVAIGLVILGQLFPRKLTQLRINETQTILFSTDEQSLIQRTHLSQDELKELVTAHPANWASLLYKAEPVIVSTSPIWPVVLAGAAFLYLWWLAILLFDLSFVWHRYIRHSTTNNRLQEWNPYNFSPRITGKNGEACSNDKRIFPTS